MSNAATLLLNGARYISKVLIHKIFVGYFCFKSRLFWRGLVHDISKFSPTELFENVKFYNPKTSPVVEARKLFGYSTSWQHHKGRNSHHYEYWVDDVDHGAKMIRMPFDDALELICDGLGASIAYNWKIKDLYFNEWKWWIDGPLKNARMHPHTRAFIHAILTRMMKSNNCCALNCDEAFVEYMWLLQHHFADVPVSCPAEDCIWKEPQTEEEKEFWNLP